jgi:hypothetical protein
MKRGGLVAVGPELARLDSRPECDRQPSRVTHGIERLRAVKDVTPTECILVRTIQAHGKQMPMPESRPSPGGFFRLSALRAGQRTRP